MFYIICAFMKTGHGKTKVITSAKVGDVTLQNNIHRRFFNYGTMCINSLCLAEEKRKEEG